MFKVTFMVDDRKLGNSLRALAGLAAEQPQAQPVVNATVKNGKVRQTTEGTNLPEMIMQHITKNNLQKISSKEAKVIVTELGYSPTSYAGALAELYGKRKLLKRLGPGIYGVKS
jgi:hypothetical protein